jgi:hypothetical protein
MAVVAVVGDRSGGPGWTAPLHVVGGPVAAEGDGLVIALDGSHHLQLAAIRPADGTVLWERPFSASGITVGVAFPPAVVGSTVLDLVPAGSARVKVEGLDVATGQVRWSLPSDVQASDAPAPCEGGALFCLPAYVGSATRPQLLMLSPEGGQVAAAVPGVVRSMAVAGPLSDQDGNLWQTSAAVPTLAEVSSAGRVEWTKTVASLFGGAAYTPDGGWVFAGQGGLEVGSVGQLPTGNTLDLGTTKTIGIVAATGAVRWSTPGAYLCFGTVNFLTSDVVCHYTGSLVRHGNGASDRGVTVTLEGLDPVIGTTTWSHPVADVGAFTGGALAFLDDTHLVVRSGSGPATVLDTTDGSAAPAVAGQAFWCVTNPTYSVAVAGLGTEKRAASPVFRPCAAGGGPVGSLPPYPQASVGVTVGGVFMWAAPGGLRGLPLRP